MPQPYTPDLPRPHSKRILWITLAVLFLTMAGSITWGWFRWKKFLAEWERLGPLDPFGGLTQKPRLELKVPLFRQADDRWRSDILGTGGTTLGAEGCAVSSAAMVLASYGIDTDPGRLNKLLTANNGYEGTAWIIWEKAAELTGNKVQKLYEGEPSHRLIDENLRAGNPVIVRLRAKNGTTHFVVIAGKDGTDYLTCDPGAGAAKGLYPLREYGSKIEALRFYGPMKK